MLFGRKELEEDSAARLLEVDTEVRWLDEDPCYNGPGAMMRLVAKRL